VAPCPWPYPTLQHCSLEVPWLTSSRLVPACGTLTCLAHWFLVIGLSLSFRPRRLGSKPQLLQHTHQESWLGLAKQGTPWEYWKEELSSSFLHEFVKENPLFTPDMMGHGPRPVSKTQLPMTHGELCFTLQVQYLGNRRQARAPEPRTSSGPVHHRAGPSQYKLPFRKFFIWLRSEFTKRVVSKLSHCELGNAPPNRAPAQGLFMHPSDPSQ